MNVGELRKLIEGVEDSVQVVTPAPDHEYRRAHASVTTAVDHQDGCSYSEDPHDPEWAPEDPRVPVLVVG